MGSLGCDNSLLYISPGRRGVGGVCGRRKWGKRGGTENRVAASWALSKGFARLSLHAV